MLCGGSADGVGAMGGGRRVGSEVGQVLGIVVSAQVHVVVSSALPTLHPVPVPVPRCRACAEPEIPASSEQRWTGRPCRRRRRRCSCSSPR